MEGKCRITCENLSAKVVAKGEMFLLPRECRYSAYPEEDSFFIVVCLRNKISFCDRFSLEQLCRMKTETENTFNPLPINDRIGGYLHWTFTYISDGLRCGHFFDLKLKELFLLLRGYYSKEDLALFFYPLLTNNQSFTDFIYPNHQKVRSIQELADLACMSLSNFKRQFRKSFGDSPYHWMKEQKALSIFHDINNSEMNLKAVMDKYDFSSPSQFNDFCKAQFGQTPGRIRKKELSEKKGLKNQD